MIQTPFHLAEIVALPRFSFVLLLGFTVIFGASLTMFLLLVRRWTTQRQWVSLAEWARQRKFKFWRTDSSELPPLLSPLTAAGVSTRLHLRSTSITVLQLQTAPAEGRDEPNRWNVLILQLPERKGKNPFPVALRPAGAAASVVDLFNLSQYPSLAIGRRFLVLASSASAARALADSASRTLLPADLGLLLQDQWILIDFSSRPFDPIELDRVILLSKQLGAML